MVAKVRRRQPSLRLGARGALALESAEAWLEGAGGGEDVGQVHPAAYLAIVCCGRHGCERAQRTSAPARQDGVRGSCVGVVGGSAAAETATPNVTGKGTTST